MVSAYSGNILRKYGNALYPEETLGRPIQECCHKVEISTVFNMCLSPMNVAALAHPSELM